MHFRDKNIRVMYIQGGFTSQLVDKNTDFLTMNLKVWGVQQLLV